VDRSGLIAEDVQTLGSLGAPGFFAWAPAISFRSDHPDAIQSAVEGDPSLRRQRQLEVDARLVRGRGSGLLKDGAGGAVAFLVHNI
jgi:hypothetical protein